MRLSTLVQQVLSTIAQHQGAQPSDLHNALCASGRFRNIDQRTFVQLLRDLGSVQLIQQEPDGLFLLGSVGERVVNHFSFYAAFVGGAEYRIVNGPRPLGSLAVRFPIPLCSFLTFTGRRWRVSSVDDQAQGIHGITDDDVHDAPKFVDIAPKIAAMLEGAIIVAHNAPFDLAFLDAEFARIGMSTRGIASLCTMKLDQRIHGEGRRSLSECLSAAGVVSAEGQRMHRARADARATVELLRVHFKGDRALVHDMLDKVRRRSAMNRPAGVGAVCSVGLLVALGWSLLSGLVRPVPVVVSLVLGVTTFAFR